MKIKVILSLILFISLASCVPIRVVPKWNPDVYNDYTVIQGFQRKDTIGHTDTKQREQDLLDCGVKKFFNGRLDLNTQYPGMTDGQVDERRNRIYNCMKSKGYIIIDSTNCTNKGKSLGVCN